MKKKTLPRLTLKRETLRQLELSTLGVAGVGIESTLGPPTGSQDPGGCGSLDTCHPCAY